MRFTDFIAEFFDVAKKDANGNYTLKMGTAMPPGRVGVEEFALFSVVDLLASMASLCEFRFYQYRKREKGWDWYQWNYSPNPDQSGPEFKRQLFARLYFFGEALVFDHGNGMYIADSFSKVTDGFAPVAFENVTFRNVTLPRRLTQEDAYYFRLGANSQAEALRQNLRRLYSELMQDARDKYHKSGGRTGILQISSTASGAPDYEEKLDQLMNDRFRRYFESDNAVLPLTDGFTYIPQNGPSTQKNTSEVSDINTVLQQAQITACNAFHVSPALLRGDVTGQKDAATHTISFALKPALRVVDAEISRGLYGLKVLDGWYCRAYCGNLLMISPFDVAANAEKLAQNRLYNPDGLRELLDDEEIGEPWAKEYVMTKNAESVAVGGAEGDGDGEN